MKSATPLLLNLLFPFLLMGHHATVQLRIPKEQKDRQLPVLLFGNEAETWTGKADTIGPDTFDRYIPVELIAFSARASGDNIILQWATACEINALEFVLFHGTDGAVWNSVAHIPAAGNSQELREYHFRHRNPVPGMNFYKLLQRDYDGKEHINEILVLPLNKVKSSVWPNPLTTPEMVIHAQWPCLMTITDISGKVMGSWSLQEGENSIEIVWLRDGVYWLSLNNARNEKEYFRIIKR